ncbi:hypothetical protein JCM8097_007280 [Rhodosporidiobolus ruineniae]
MTGPAVYEVHKPVCGLPGQFRFPPLSLAQVTNAVKTLDLPVPHGSLRACLWRAGVDAGKEELLLHALQSKGGPEVVPGVDRAQATGLVRAHLRIVRALPSFAATGWNDVGDVLLDLAYGAARHLGSPPLDRVLPGFPVASSPACQPPAFAAAAHQLVIAFYLRQQAADAAADLSSSPSLDELAEAAEDGLDEMLDGSGAARAFSAWFPRLA